MIQIPDKTLAQAASKGMDEFLKTFTDAYLSAVGSNLNVDAMDKLNAYQHTLLAYRFLSDEINEGGFVQLIQNGYGGYIFGNPVAKALKLFGAVEMGKLLYKAKEIYEVHRERLERETSDDEFMAMYEEFEAFDDLEEQFFTIEEETTATIARFVDENLSEFARVTY
ncbi:MAG: DMP19 family protein [Dysgonamonadaceae bacterium]|nr:DMP19 family protein [Dysgonamonadaceae bacterium]